MLSTLHKRRRIRMLAAAGLAAGAMAGCQSYEPVPLRLGEHGAAFLARTPEGTEVAAFAKSLREQAAQGAVERGRDFDLSDGVTIAEAEATAMVFNADLRVARLKAGVTQAGERNAGLWEDPTLGVDLTRIIQSVEHPWKIMSSVGITIPVSGRLEVEREKATAEHAAELARIVEQEWGTRIELRRAWVEWSALEAQRGATREFLTRLDEVVGVVDTLERAGEMARTEARLFRIERGTRQADLASIELREVEARATVVRLIGLSPTAPVTLTAMLEPTGGSEDVAAAREALSARNPTVLVAVTEYEVAERALKLEVRKQYPDLTVGPGYGREDGDDELLLGVSLPIPVLNGNRRGIAEARAQRDVARAVVEGALERAMSELHAAEAQRRAAATAREGIEREIVPMVDAQYADTRRAAQLGELNTLVLLETLTRQHEAKVKLVEARRDEVLAAIRFDGAAGPAVGVTGGHGDVGTTSKTGDAR